MEVANCRWVRLTRHTVLFISVLCGSGAAQPLVLQPLPLPGRFTELQQSSSGALLVSYGAWSEYGGSRPSMLRRGSQWLKVPAGASFEWRDWFVFEGLFALPYRDDESVTRSSPWDGGTQTVSVGTDDSFVRRVVLVNAKTGKHLEAPWDTLAPLPLGRGDTWLLWRCAPRVAPDGGLEQPMELLGWTPRTGRSVIVGELPGDGCSLVTAATHLSLSTFPEGEGRNSFAWSPVVIPSGDGALVQLRDDGGTRWVQLDARARIVRTVADAGVQLTEQPWDAGSPLRPFRRVTDAFIDHHALKTVDGRALMGAVLDAGTPIALTPSLGGGFAVHEGLVFTDEGVFRLPANAPALSGP